MTPHTIRMLFVWIFLVIGMAITFISLQLQGHTTYASLPFLFISLGINLYDISISHRI